jgi:peptidylprolyl isomerase
MRAARIGDRVKIDYTIMSNDGVVFETSRNGNPLVFTIGKGEVTFNVEKNVVGMKPGEGFYPKLEGLTLNLRKCDLPHDARIYIGQEIVGQCANGDVLRLFIADINDEIVTLEQKHPLSGKTLALSIELLEVYEI